MNDDERAACWSEEKTKLKRNTSPDTNLNKAFSRGVDEKSSVHTPFKTYMLSRNQKVEFVKFNHNRFKILFLMGKIRYHHRLG